MVKRRDKKKDKNEFENQKYSGEEEDSTKKQKKRQIRIQKTELFRQNYDCKNIASPGNSAEENNRRGK